MALKPGDVVTLEPNVSRQVALWNVPWPDGHRPASRHVVAYASGRSAALVIVMSHGEALVVSPDGTVGWVDVSIVGRVVRRHAAVKKAGKRWR